MKQNIFAVTLLFYSVLSASATASACARACQKSMIENYFSTLAEVYRSGSAESDIDRLFQLFHEDTQYEHVEYEASFNKGDWEVAFKNNLESGRYNAEPADSIRVENYIFGKSHVAVEYSYGEKLAGGEWQPKGDQKLLALFGFSGDKIVLIREYW